MSDRSWSTTIETELDAANASIALLVEVDLVSGFERLWTGVGDISYGGNTYTGAGELGHIDKIAEGVDKSDLGVNLTLNYLNDTIRNEFVTNDQAGRDVSIYFAVVDVDAATVTDAYEYFVGFIDRVEILDGGEEGGSLVVRVASELALLQKRRFVALTDAAQQWLFPGDIGMAFAAQMDQPIEWGRKTIQPGTNNRNWDRDYYSNPDYWMG